MAEGKEPPPTVNAESVRELKPGETSAAKKIRIDMGQPKPHRPGQSGEGEKQDPLRKVREKFGQAEEILCRVTEKVKRKEEAAPKRTSTPEEIRKEREIEEELKKLKEKRQGTK